MFEQGSLLRGDRDFRTLWMGETVLRLGSGLRNVAIPWLILVLTGSPLSLGLSFALLRTPDVLFSPVLGYAIDRHSRRRLMCLAVISEGALLLVLPVAQAAGWLSIRLVYAVLVVLSITGGLYHNAREAILPEIVPGDRLDEANAAFYVGSTAVGIVFLGVGGVLTDQFGAVETLAGAAVAAWVAAPLLAMVSETPPEVTDLGGARDRLGGFLADLREGIGRIRGTIVRDVIAFGLVINVAVTPYTILIATVAYDEVALAIAYAGLLAAFRVGGILGNVGVGRVPLSRERKYATGILAVGLVALVLAGVGPLLVPIESILPFGVLAALLLALGAVQPLFNVPSDSLVQLAADEANRGRVVSLTNAALQVTFPIGYLAGGYLAARVSSFHVFALSGAIMIALGVLAFYRFGSDAAGDSSRTA
ncbi:MAG: MFS family permease [Natronomonas sp.]